VEIGSGNPGATVTLRWHTGPRNELRQLFELAEDSAAAIDASLDSGIALVAQSGDSVIGLLQLTSGSPLEAEIKTMAVAEDWQGRGLGRALVEVALKHAHDSGTARVVVATAAADVGNLRFYQRQGFRIFAVERDAFTTATGYPESTLIDGIELRDRVWLDRLV
jgi:ribosomal protein S18 acetylase RimI-like enzyme